MRFAHLVRIQDFKQPRAKRFESPRPALAGRCRNSRSELRVRGSIQEHDAWIEPLTPPSPREGRGEGDERAQLRILAARRAPELLRRSPSKIRGRRECRVMTSPMARLQQKKQAAVTTGSAGSTGIPCAMVYGLYRALPGDHRLVATVVRRTYPATLAPASERQDHTTLPSAGKLTRLVNCRVHRIPLPTSVTIAIRPSGGGGTGQKMLVICPTPQARFTATHWHDGQFAYGGHARIARRANQFAHRAVHSRTAVHLWRHVILRECGVSSTPCPLDLIADVSGILDHPHARVMTTASAEDGLSPSRVRLHPPYLLWFAVTMPDESVTRHISAASIQNAVGRPPNLATKPTAAGPTRMPA
jgi:hypothetical protein